MEAVKAAALAALFPLLFSAINYLDGLARAEAQRGHATRCHVIAMLEDVTGQIESRMYGGTMLPSSACHGIEASAK